ncbi:MAG: PQQ-binding-like beta-propeller repeat protein [Acidobacteriota bacterium]
MAHSLRTQSSTWLRLPVWALALLLAAGWILAIAPQQSEAEDWPQWRGQERDGKAPSTGLLQSWPEAGPPLAWQAAGLGSGFSSVSVADGKVFTLGDKEGSQHAFALEDGSGKLLWAKEIGPSWDDRYLGPRSTPTYSDGQVFVLSTEGDLYCLDAATGETHWQRNLPKDFGGHLMLAQGRVHWKFAESPLVDGDRVIVTPGANDAALVALDRKSGEEIWRTQLPQDLGPAGLDGAGYSSVVISNAVGTKQYVQLLGRGVIGVDAASGKFLWAYNKVANDIANIATPLVDGDYIFASTGYNTGSALIHLQSVKGENGRSSIQAEEVYFLPGNKMQNHHGGLILHRDHVFTGTGHNKGLPLAVRLKDGEIAWGPERNKGKSSAAIAYADGRLYLRYQDGLVILAEATPEAYREHGSFRIPNVEHESWPHPVIAHGLLYLREQDKLYVYDLRAPQASSEAAAR